FDDVAVAEDLADAHGRTHGGRLVDNVAAADQEAVVHVVSQQLLDAPAERRIVAARRFEKGAAGRNVERAGCAEQVGDAIPGRRHDLRRPRSQARAAAQSRSIVRGVTRRTSAVSCTVSPAKYRRWTIEA